MRQRSAIAGSRWCPAAVVAAAAALLAACGSSPPAPSQTTSSTSSTTDAEPTGFASPTPGPLATFTGNVVALTNVDNGRVVSVPVGSSVAVSIAVPRSDDCLSMHPCVVPQMVDGEGVLSRSTEITTCDDTGCTVARRIFVDHPGIATLGFVTQDQCGAASGARCVPATGGLLWQVRIEAG